MENVDVAVSTTWIPGLAHTGKSMIAKRLVRRYEDGII